MQFFLVPRYNVQHCFSPAGLYFLGVLISSLLGFTQVQALETITTDSVYHSDTLLGHRGKQRLQDPLRKDSDISELSSYEPEFPLISRSIIGRADDSQNEKLENNVPGRKSISPGDKQYWVFPATELHKDCSTEARIMPRGQGAWSCEDQPTKHTDLKRQAADRRLYITLSVCTQPTPSGNNIDEPPPNLQLFISWTQPKPGSAGDGNTIPVDVTQGFGEYSNPQSQDVFIAVEALSNSNYSGQYGYELTGSIDARYSDYDDSESLYHIESDYQSGFFLSSNLTDSSDSHDPRLDEYMKNDPPFSIFIHNENDTSIEGMRRSYCALNRSLAEGSQRYLAVANMTTIGGGEAKQQFYVSGLDKNSSYYATMALATNVSDKGDGHPTGGGMVWKSVKFSTTSSKRHRFLF